MSSQVNDPNSKCFCSRCGSDVTHWEASRTSIAGESPSPTHSDAQALEEIIKEFLMATERAEFRNLHDRAIAALNPPKESEK